MAAVLEPIVIVESALTALAVYAGLGLLFAVPFVAVGVRRIDPDAREGSRGFRLLIFPGVVALWPLLLRRWMRASGPREENNAHRRASRAKPGGES